MKNFSFTKSHLITLALFLAVTGSVGIGTRQYTQKTVFPAKADNLSFISRFNPNKAGSNATLDLQISSITVTDGMGNPMVQTNAVPADGKILIKLGKIDDFDFSKMNAATCDFDGAVSVSRADDTIILTRSGGTPVPAGKSYGCFIPNIKLPPYSNFNGISVAVTITTDQNQMIDSAINGSLPITYGDILNPKIELQDTKAGALTNMTISFTPTNPIPKNGQIMVQFPMNWDYPQLNKGPSNDSSSKLLTPVSVNGTTFSVGAGDRAADGFYINADGYGSGVPGGTRVSFTITNVKNPPTVGALPPADPSGMTLPRILIYTGKGTKELKVADRDLKNELTQLKKDYKDALLGERDQDVIDEITDAFNTEKKRILAEQNLVKKELPKAKAREAGAKKKKK